MESALFLDFFGNFYMVLFSAYAWWDWTHVRWDWNKHRKTQNSEKLEISFFGWRGTLVRWGGVCEVRYARWGMQDGVCKVGYARWGMQGGIHEVRFMQGEIYTRWDLHEERFMWGGICQVRFMRGEIYASHLLKIFTPWYLINFPWNYMKRGKLNPRESISLTPPPFL